MRVRNPFMELHQTAWNSPQRKLAHSSITPTFYMMKESNVNAPVVSRSMAALLLISWNQMNRPGRPHCGGVSDAGSWPPVSSPTEVNGTCQFHDKYQIVCRRLLEIEPHRGGEVAIRLMNC